MTNSPPPVRLGIAGCGNVLGAYLALATRLRHQGLADVAVLCGRERQRASALAGWPTAEFGTDYPALLARKDVDAIVLLTPMIEHAPMAKAVWSAVRPLRGAACRCGNSWRGWRRPSSTRMRAPRLSEKPAVVPGARSGRSST